MASLLLESSIPQPHTTIGAQELIQREACTRCGWLRKKGKINFITALRIRWTNMFVVLSKGCLYHFSSETSRSPNGAVSLYGYNVVHRAGDVLQSEAPWAFKIIHAKPEMKTYYFSAASEAEMKEWMKDVKREMLYANGKTTERSKPDGESRHNSVALDAADVDALSQTYDDLEKQIYDDCSEVSMPKNLIRLEDSDDEDYLMLNEDEMQDNITSPTKRSIQHSQSEPRIPRPKNTSQTLPDVKQLTKEMNMKIPLRPLPKLPGKREDMHKKLPAGAKPALPLKPDLPRKPKLAVKPFNTIGPETEKRKSPDGQSSKSKTFDLAAYRRDRSDSVPDEVAPAPPRPLPKLKPIKEKVRDSESYWASVFWHGDKDEANECLRNLGEEGVYLVRDSECNQQVLVVYASGHPKKYRICHKPEEGYWLKEDTEFPTLPDLLYYYHSNELPTVSVKLKRPYSLSK
ncbi:SH3 domain-binding protein 2 [Lingula anatina]|uniref:SH3 domain-binding protein 2 n=1 Tax=Lingula anatina TaxID=7574 RepID=A0A1S3HE18_LINAN|nr:SH3 domain-binding protein 2 [Lingula anatina]|eukprot:XP_013383314.1 SH3 domain-binding protein 2 [Lingula anatina]